MAYRDDHEAAIARADKLENDLETAAEKSAGLEREVEELRARNRQLEAKLAREPERALSREPAGQFEPDEPQLSHIPIWREDNEDRRFDLVGVGIALAIFFGTAFFFVALVMEGA